MSHTDTKYTGTPNLEITALSLAAKRAGMSYGTFVAQIPLEKRWAIVQDYKKRRSRKKSGDTSEDPSENPNEDPGENPGENPDEDPGEDPGVNKQ